MNNIKEFLLRHPTRSKYILLILDIFFVLVATKMFINYTNIRQAIDETAVESANKLLELAYTENFELPYEKSDYAEFFLKHENNMILNKEFIVKFQTISANSTGNIATTIDRNHFIETPEGSRKQFFYEKLFLKQEDKNALKE